MKDRTILALVAMIVIGSLEIAALLTGIDGTVLTLVVAAVAGLGGYEIAKNRGS